MPQDDSAKVIGQVLGGRYRVAHQIGKGCFTDTYLGYDLARSRRVAIKLLSSDCVPGDAKAHNEVLVSQYFQAAETAMRLKHPHLVTVWGWGNSDFGPYIVSDFLAGGSLRQMLATGYLLSPSQALVVGLEAARGLELIHRQGHVHGDIRPSNLMFDRRGSTLLVDLGISEVLATAEASGTLLRRLQPQPLQALRYASPEQAQGLAPDHKSDVYALILVVTESLVGRVPFDSDDPEVSHIFKMSRQLDLAGQFGALGQVLESSAIPERDTRPDAQGLVRSLLSAAERLPRPEPLPLPSEGVDTPEVVLPLDSDAADVADAKLVSAAPLAKQVATVRKSVLVLLAIVLLGGIGAGAYWLWNSLFGTDHPTVPNLVGVTETELSAIVSNFDWVLERREVRLDGTVPGEVVRQAPAPGAHLAKGDTLIVFISLGPELVLIPQNLVGMAISEARLALANVGLVVGQTQFQHDEVVPDGIIIKVAEMFVEVEAASSVDLLVSLGPALRTVPDIPAGTSLPLAREMLEKARFGILELQANSNEIPVNRVIRTEPPAGTQLPADYMVIIEVSLGPVEVVVPDLITLTTREADVLLNEAMLCLSEIDGPTDTEIVASTPPAGVTIPSGTCVTVITRP
ncbi:MAG: protein kinase [Acidimicrobiia bacterium]|nr:protein kinase [Acidimicrobiia bacterium]MYC58558.1 protein kinase [Acidimicrobiia bacterium]MYI30335.1 protein kinase [Acidimicrobiia bacterium]